MANSDNSLLVEKYRPSKLENYVGNENIKKSISKYLDQNDIQNLIFYGPAGTGKTYLAILAAIQAMRNRECDRIVLCRPSVSIEDENHGFLPGTLTEKLAPWVRPMVDVLHEFYAVKEVELMLAEQTVEFAPLGYMRGRTFKNTWIIADEMQNATPTQLKMLLTRIGTNSKIVITGDADQSDIKHGNNALVDLCERLQKGGGVKGIVVCPLENRDIQRHPIISKILEIYKD